MNAQFNVPQTDIAAFCERWQVKEFAFFGSVLRQDFGPKSDIDVLLQFAPKAHHSLLDMVRMQGELSRALGRKVDLVDRSAVEASRNHIRRATILGSAQIVYAA